MKKIMLMAVMALMGGNILLASDATAQKDSAVIAPEAVVKAFDQQFSGAKLHKWLWRKEGYIADFRKDGKKYFAYYSADGAWKGTESPIKWTKDLPAAVKQGWKNSGYYAWYVEDIKKIESPDSPMYVLHVDNGSLLDSDHHDAFRKEFVLFFSAKGDLIRKEQRQ